MILKNKLTKESLVLTRSEFYTKFAKEIQAALESYLRTENSKPYFKTNKPDASDFYFDLQWNFNHFGMSNLYIEKI
jgi:hypothetical protein